MPNNTTNSVQTTVCELAQVQTQLRGVDGGTQIMQQSQDSKSGSSESGGSQPSTERNGSDQLRGVMPEMNIAVEQLLAAAEGNDDNRVRSILTEQGLENLHKLAETGALDLIIRQQGLTKLLYYGEQTSNIDLMRIVLGDPQQAQGCTGLVLAFRKGQTKVLRLHLLNEAGEVMTAFDYLDQIIETLSRAISQQILTESPVEAESLQKKLKMHKNAINAILVGVEAESLQKKLKMHKNAINAILVGAAVLVGVTFQFFLQAPNNPPFILMYCIYNSLSFYSAVATMITGAGAALPVDYSSIEEEMRITRKWVRASSLLLAVSVICVLGAVPGPNYGNPPNVTRNVAVTTTRCVGIFLCAAAMTAYALRLNWKFIQNSDGNMLKRLTACLPAFLMPTKHLGKKSLQFWELVGVVISCGLISSLFLAILFFLPFYHKFPGEWTQSPGPTPRPG